MTKEYFGDGVYADFDGYHIVLTTENGISITNTIFLNYTVAQLLQLYIEQQSEGANEKHESDYSKAQTTEDG